MMSRLAFGTLMVAATAAPGTVYAQGQAQGPPMCGDRSEVVSALAQRYAETPISVGLSNTGHILEILTSTNGSWSILITGPNGRSCLVAAGDSWQQLPAQVSGTRS